MERLLWPISGETYNLKLSFKTCKDEEKTIILIMLETLFRLKNLVAIKISHKMLQEGFKY